MSKIAYVGCLPTVTPIQTVPVVNELVKRGHEVLYYNAETFRPKAAQTGVDFRPLPEPLPTEREIAEALHEFINASLIISRMSRHLTRYLIAELAREKTRCRHLRFGRNVGLYCGSRQQYSPDLLHHNVCS